MRKKSEQIEKYLNGELSPEESSAFERELEADKALFGEYQLRKEINESIMDEQALQIQDSLKKIMTKETKSAPAYQTLYKVAAAIVGFVIVSAAVMYFVTADNTNRSTLFAQYYQPSDAVMIVRSGDTETDNNLIQGMQAYDDGDFDRAVKLLNSVNENITATFYAALSYVELEEFDQAERKFKNIIADGDNLFIDQAEWYSALLKLKTGKKDEARKAFIDISNSNSFYNIKASRILVKLTN